MDLLIVFLLSAILGGAGYAIYRSKKSGRKCIGCPSGGGCAGCAGCSGSCGK